MKVKQDIRVEGGGRGLLGELQKGLYVGFTLGFFIGCIVEFRVGKYKERCI